MAARSLVAAMLLAAAISPPAARAEAPVVARVQAALEGYVASRAAAEHITGIAAYVSFGSPGPAIEAFAGRVGTAADAGPVRQDTLFQMGSTSKSFTAAVVLKLAAAGVLSLDDNVGRFLPQYPAWADVTLRRLLNMTSGIPNYSETEAISRIMVQSPDRVLRPEELVQAVYPTGVGDLPVVAGYHYSNTNYVLASMIAAKAAGREFRALVQEMVIDAFGLDSTFYAEDAYPPAVIARLAHGYFFNPACADYQPNCSEPWLQPLIGRNVRAASTSWAQGAGGAVASARDVDRWMRAVFMGRVVPAPQQAAWMALVSTRTGAPLAEVTAEDPRGFSLGLSKAVVGKFGPQWFYQGETLGYRTLYVWFASEGIMITLQTNSQPAAGEDRLGELLGQIYEIVR